MAQGLGHTRAQERIRLHQAEYEVPGARRAVAIWPVEQRLDIASPQGVPVRILCLGVAGGEEGLPCQKRERAPAETPSVHLGGQIGLAPVQLWGPERLAHQSTEGHRQLLSAHAALEQGGVPWVADPHLEGLGVQVHVEEHVLQGNVLHRQASPVQKGQPGSGLLHQALDVRFLVPPAPRHERLEQVAPAGQRRHDADVVATLHPLLHLNHVPAASHQLREADLVQGHLAERLRGGAPRLLQRLPVGDLDGEPPARGLASSLEDAPEDGVLEVADQVVVLAAALQLLLYHLRRIRRVRGGRPHLRATTPHGDPQA